MPRGDGTGPPGAGDRGRGGGRGMGPGRGRGRGPGRYMQQFPQAYVADNATRSPGFMVPTSSRNTRPVAHINEEACTLCGACQATCPAEAIIMGETAFKVNAEACRGCGACVEVCPTEAISLN